MSRFLRPHQININSDSNDFRLGQFELKKIDEGDLWELPLSEFLSFDYMRAILYIFKKKNATELPYETIKEIFDEYNYPTYCGLVMSAINILEAQYAVTKIRKGKSLYISIGETNDYNCIY